MDFFITTLPHFFTWLTHIPGLFDIALSLGFFVAGRLTGGIGLLLKVAILLIRMAKHFYDTHPDAHRQKRSTKIDNIFDTLFKHEVISNERRLKETHETQAKG